jgi:hypothetical protein
MKGLWLALALLPCAALAHLPLNPAVAQDNIAATICTPGYSASIRPATSYTNRIKRRLMSAVGLAWSRARDYELDHRISLVLGGSPKDPDNLMLQAWRGQDGGHAKDRLEMRLKRMVCAGQIPLHEAQACIYDDWQACAQAHPPTAPTKGKP